MPKHTAINTDSLFCSELLALVYQGIGLLPKYGEGGQLPNEFSPCDFSSDMSSRHPLVKGELEQEVMFGFPPGTTSSEPEDMEDSEPPKTHLHRRVANHKHFREHFGERKHGQMGTH